MKIKYRRDLWQLLTGLLAGNAAELGVAEGNFSRDILNWPVKFPRLYLVDRWKFTPAQKGDASNSQKWHDGNWADVQKKTAEYGDRVICLRGDTTEMADMVPDRSLVLVYVDADHSYKAVMADIKAWASKLVAGGIMAFHDYDNPAYGVKDAVQHFCRLRRLQVNSIPEDKPEDAGAWFQWEGGAC
jgi:hypothetical protein